MCYSNIPHISIIGEDLYDFKVKHDCEKYMQPFITQRLHMPLELAPHVSVPSLRLILHEQNNRITLYVPVNSNCKYSISQLLTYIFENAGKNPPLLEHLKSCDFITHSDMNAIREHLNQKF